MARLISIDVNGQEREIVTHVVNNTNGGFINIKHGMKEGWEVRFSLDSRMFIPNEPVYFTSNSFIVNPIMKDNKEVKDKQGNTYHVISKNKLRDHKNDVIVMMDTLIKYDEFKINKDPSCYLIGKAINVIDGVRYLAPIFEVYEKGKVVLEDNTSKLTIMFNNGKIELIKD